VAAIEKSGVTEPPERLAACRVTLPMAALAWVKVTVRV